MTQAHIAYKLEEAAEAPRALVERKARAGWHWSGAALRRAGLGWYLPLLLLGVWTLAAHREWVSAERKRWCG